MNSIDYLMSLENRGVKFGLNNIRRLLDAVDNPQTLYPSVHVAGTNGKGSVVACVASALRAAGLKVGAYTSPHLLRFNERIAVDGKDIPDDALARLIDRFRPVADGMEHAEKVDLPTFFEFSTAIAFAFFAEQKVDFAVIETGLGGRLDSTNVLEPEVAVVTNISVDHTDYLGSTVRSIAEEKAGIINGSGPVVTAVTQPEAVDAVEAACALHDVEMYRCGNEFRYTSEPREFPQQLVTVDLLKKPAKERKPVIARSDRKEATRQSRLRNTLSFKEIAALPSVARNDACVSTLEIEVHLAGAHQAENVAVAAMVCSLLQAGSVPSLTDEAIRTGFETARWPGRLDVVREQPLTIVDAAHNPAGAAALRKTLEDYIAGRPIILVLAISGDKNVGEMTDALCPMARHVVATQYNMHRTMPADELLVAVRRHVPDAVSAPSVADAIAVADEIAGPDDVIVIAGSVFTVGDALAHFTDDSNEVAST